MRSSNKKGFVAVTALFLTVLIMLIGSSSMIMTRLGFTTTASERSYQLAKAAASAGVNDAAFQLKNGISCSSISPTGGGYTFIRTSSGNNCLVRVVGTSGNSKVVMAVTLSQTTASGGSGSSGTFAIGFNHYTGTAASFALTNSSLITDNGSTTNGLRADSAVYFANVDNHTDKYNAIKSYKTPAAWQGTISGDVDNGSVIDADTQFLNAGYTTDNITTPFINKFNTTRTQKEAIVSSLVIPSVAIPTPVDVTPDATCSFSMPSGGACNVNANNSVQCGATTKNVASCTSIKVTSTGNLTFDSWNKTLTPHVHIQMNSGNLTTNIGKTTMGGHLYINSVGGNASLTFHNSTTVGGYVYANLQNGNLTTLSLSGSATINGYTYINVPNGTIAGVSTSGNNIINGSVYLVARAEISGSTIGDTNINGDLYIRSTNYTVDQQQVNGASIISGNMYVIGRADVTRTSFSNSARVNGSLYVQSIEGAITTVTLSNTARVYGSLYVIADDNLNVSSLTNNNTHIGTDDDPSSNTDSQMVYLKSATGNITMSMSNGTNIYGELYVYAPNGTINMTMSNSGAVQKNINIRSGGRLTLNTNNASKFGTSENLILSGGGIDLTMSNGSSQGVGYILDISNNPNTTSTVQLTNSVTVTGFIYLNTINTLAMPNSTVFDGVLMAKNINQLNLTNSSTIKGAVIVDGTIGQLNLANSSKILGTLFADTIGSVTLTNSSKIGFDSNAIYNATSRINTYIGSDIFKTVPEAGSGGGAGSGTGTPGYKTLKYDIAVTKITLY